MYNVEIYSGLTFCTSPYSCSAQYHIDVGKQYKKCPSNIDFDLTFGMVTFVTPLTSLFLLDSLPMQYQCSNVVPLIV